MQHVIAVDQDDPVRNLLKRPDNFRWPTRSAKHDVVPALHDDLALAVLVALIPHLTQRDPGAADLNHAGRHGFFQGSVIVGAEDHLNVSALPSGLNRVQQSPHVAWPPAGRAQDGDQYRLRLCFW